MVELQCFHLKGNAELQTTSLDRENRTGWNLQSEFTVKPFFPILSSQATNFDNRYRLPEHEVTEQERKQNRNNYGSIPERPSGSVLQKKVWNKNTKW